VPAGAELTGPVLTGAEVSAGAELTGPELVGAGSDSAGSSAGVSAGVMIGCAPVTGTNQFCFSGTPLTGAGSSTTTG
jgi:hypothetical protein